MSNIYLSKNLKYLRTKYKYSQQQISEKLETTRGAYKDYELANFPKPEMLFKISDFYNISIDDIFRVDLEVQESNREKAKFTSLKEIKDREQKILVVTVDNNERENIEFVPEKAKAGYTSGYTNPHFIGQLPKFNLPYLPTGTYRAFEIQGDSMPPITHKSIIIGKYIENANFITNLNTYILVTKDDGIVYKRIIYTGQKEIMLVSDNPTYQSYSLSVNEVLEIWAYHCHISFDGDNAYNKKLLEEMLKMTSKMF